MQAHLKVPTNPEISIRCYLVVKQKLNCKRPFKLHRHICNGKEAGGKYISMLGVLSC